MTSLTWARSQLVHHHVTPHQRKQAIRTIRKASGLAIPLPRACEYVDRMHADNVLIQEILRSEQSIEQRVDQAIEAILAHPDVVLAAVDEARADVAHMRKPAVTITTDAQLAYEQAADEFALNGDESDADELPGTVWIPLKLKPAKPDTSGFWHQGEMADEEPLVYAPSPALQGEPQVDPEYWPEDRKGILRRVYGWVLAVFTEQWTARTRRELSS